MLQSGYQGSDSLGARVAHNAYRIGRGTVLEGEIPGVLFTPATRLRCEIWESQSSVALGKAVIASVRFA